MTNERPISRNFYNYDPDADSFAGVGFVVGEVDDDNDDGSKVADLHRTDTPQQSTWNTLNCFGFDDNPTEIGDFPSVSNWKRVPIMSERAWTVLKPIIGDVCEALPVKHPFQGSYYVIHVMQTIDALNTELSEVDRSSVGDNRILRIYRYAFKSDLIEGKHIFKLPLMSGGGLFVDDVFRKAVEDNCLRGLRFKELVMQKDVRV